MPYQWQGVGTSATSGVSGGRVPNSQLGFTEPEDERFKFSFGSMFSPIGKGISRGWSELDKPLSERIGFRFEDRKGPWDDIGNFLLEEGTRPTNALFALPGVGASNLLGRAALMGGRRVGGATGLQAIPKIGRTVFGSPAWEGVGAGTIRGGAKIGRAIVEPVAGYEANLGARLAAETAVTAGAAAAARGVNEILPENTSGGWLGIGAPVLGGLLGGIGGAAAITRGLKAAGYAPDLASITRMDNMLKSASKTTTPQGRQALFTVLEADEVLKKQFANRKETLEARTNAMLDMSGLLEESGTSPSQGGGGVKNQIKWMEMLVDRNNERLKNQGHKSGMSMEQKLRFLSGSADADIKDLPTTGQRDRADRLPTTRIPTTERDFPRPKGAAERLEFQREMAAQSSASKEAYKQFHHDKWWEVDALKADEQAAMGSEFSSVLQAKDALSTTDALVNYLENKELRGGRQFFGDVAGLDELMNFGIGEDENLIRILAFDDELYDQQLFHGVEGREIAKRRASNPTIQFLHAAGVARLNVWAAEVAARNQAMIEAGDNWVSGEMAIASRKMEKAGMGGKDGSGMFDISHDQNVRATGRLRNKGQLKVIEDANGRTGYDLSQKAVEEGRITQEQKDFFSDIIRGAAMRFQMLKRAGIEVEKISHKGQAHVRSGKRVKQTEYNKAQAELAEKKEMDDFFGEEVEVSPLAAEMEELGMGTFTRKGGDEFVVQGAIINDTNPLIGDVLELGIYDAELEELLDEVGGAFFHREVYNDPQNFRLKNQRPRRRANTDTTQERVGDVEGWEIDSPLARTMEESLLLTDNFAGYEGNFAKVYEAELRAFVDMLADQQLVRDTAVRGKTETQVMREMSYGLYSAKHSIGQQLATVREGLRTSQDNQIVSDARASDAEGQQVRLEKELKEIYSRFLKLNALDTPASRGYDSRGSPVDFEGETINVPRRIGDDMTDPVFPDAEGRYPTVPDEQGQPELQRRGEFDVQDVTFRAQLKIDTLNLANQSRELVKSIRDTVDLINQLETSFLPRRKEYQDVARRLGGLRSALMKAQDGVKAKKEFTTTRGRHVEKGESLQRNIRDMDDQILDILGEGWEIRQVDANALGLGRTPEGQMRRVYDRPVYGESQSFAFHLNGEPISMERVLENLESHTYDKNGNSRLGGRFTSKDQITAKKDEYKELFHSYVEQTEKVNGILHKIEEVEKVYNFLVQEVSNNVGETNALNAAVSGEIADNSVQAGTQLSYILNNFDRGVYEQRLKLLQREYDAHGTLAQLRSNDSAAAAKKTKSIEERIKKIQRDKENIDIRYDKALKDNTDGNLLEQVPNLSNQLNGTKYYSPAAARELMMQLTPENMDGRMATALWNATNAFNNTMRPVMAAFDLSALGIQGMLAIGANPAQAAQMFKIATKSIIGRPQEYNEFILNNYSKSIKGKASIQQAIADGLHWSAEDSIGEFGMDVGEAGTNILLHNKFSRAVGISKGAELSNQHFSRTGNLMRYMMYQQALEGSTWHKNISQLVRGVQPTKLSELPDKDRRELIKVINEATGWSSGKPKDLESALLFAPRFFKSQLNILAKAVKGNTPANQYAGDLLVRTLALGAFFTMAANEARGHHTDMNPIKSTMDGKLYYNTNFMRIKDVAGADISVFGPWDTLSSMVTMAFTDGPASITKRTMEYKASPFSKVLTDIFKGRNFEGQEVFRNANPISIMGDVYQEGTGFLPFSLQDVIEPLPIVGADGTPFTPVPLFNFMGIKGTPTTATERRDKSVSAWVSELTPEARDELGFEETSEYQKYRDLTGKGRQAFNDSFPEHEENMRESRGKFARQGDDVALGYLAKGDIRADRMDTIETLVNHYESGAQPPITMSKLLDLISDENKKAAVRRADVDKTFQTAITNPDLSDPNDKAMHDFYTLYSNPLVEVAPNIMDWQAYDALYAQLYDSWTPEQRRWVDSRQPAQYPDSIQPFMDAKTYISRSGYYNVGSELYTKRKQSIHNLLTQNNYTVPETWTGFDAIWTDMKRTNPALAAQLARFHRDLGGQIGALKDRFVQQDERLGNALVMTGRRTNPEYSMRMGTR